MGKASNEADDYSAQEAQRRTEAALRAAFNAPHKPQSEMKVGKSKPQPTATMKRRARRKKG
jgi:hypothetical protein